MIQRCSQMTPKGYTYHRKQLGDSCTRSTTVETSDIEENISQKYQHDHNLRHCFPDASAPIIFCANCRRGFKAQIGLFTHQLAKHVTDETLHWCHHRAWWTAKRESMRMLRCMRMSASVWHFIHVYGCVSMHLWTCIFSRLSNHPMLAPVSQKLIGIYFSNLA